ncbi:MAG: DMT family transporter [Candidatus Micrarchaeota archaeon]|nr:DMT family transporter [Candidatus Micrarchaeota archaeon]
MLGYGIIAALLSLFFFSIGDTLSKHVSEKLGNKASATIIVGAGIIPLGLSIFLIQPNVLDLNVLLLSTLAGAFTAIGFLLVFKSLETQQVTNTLALVNLQYAVIILFGILALSESVSASQYLGLILIFLGALLVTLTRGFRLNLMLVPAILGMIFWGLDIIVVVYGLTIYHNSTTILFFFARATGAAFLLAYLLYSLRGAGTSGVAQRPKVSTRYFFIGLAAGIADGIAILLITFVTLYNTVALGGAILALEPILITIYGYLFYKDRLLPLQLVGVAIAVVGGILLNLA